jgi:hypothetical protein
VVVVCPQLFVLEVVLTLFPLQVPEVVVCPQLFVLEVRLQLALTGINPVETTTKASVNERTALALDLNFT